MKEENANVIKLYAIEPDELIEYVNQNVDFDLPEDVWIAINNGYAEFYNSLSSYDTFYGDEIFDYMLQYLSKEKIIYPMDRLEKIHKLIFEYLEEKGTLTPN